MTPMPFKIWKPLKTIAMSEYLKSHKYQNVIESLNKVYSQTAEKLDEELALMQMNSIPQEEW